MTDSHTHLVEDLFKNNITIILDTFVEQGGKHLLNTAYSLETIFTLIEINQQYNHLYPDLIQNAIGIHPTLFHPISEYNENYFSYQKASIALNKLSKLLSKNINIVNAIGETGLDYYQLYKDHLFTKQQIDQSIELQKYAFRRHVELAEEHRKPLTIHTRDIQNRDSAVVDALQIISETSETVRGSFHSYTGNSKYLKDIVGLGFFVGINGIVTYKKADNVRTIVKQTPLQNILLETDAPYLPPDQIRKNKKLATRYGQPADILYIAEAVAEIKSKSLEYILDATDENYRRFVGLEE